MSQSARTLVDFLVRSAAQRASHPAVEDLPNGTISYAELNTLSDRARDHFIALGVRRGDRVGISLRKSIDAYAATLGAMKAGAAYVPIDTAMPAHRAITILADCAMRALVIDASLTSAWADEAGSLERLPPLVEIERAGGGHGLTAAFDARDRVSRAPSATTADLEPGDLAYILYTSGSTGTPKGVMLTHESAVSHVDWCSEAFAPDPEDRFSSHAPFHFDLSITDLYVPLKHGATVVLIDADHGKEPMGLGQLIAERRLTFWYSTPSVLTVLSQAGKMERYDYSALRCVLFAGEVFPVKHLRRLRQQWRTPAFFNLYGPTETNVCTWHPIPAAMEEERSEPYPIGRPCSIFRARVVDERGVDVAPGVEGELVVSGRGMMKGYWGDPRRTEAAFLSDAAGTRWYRTGDIVTEHADQVFSYIGRRDRMVKRRGFRIELGEIESALYRHPAIAEVAALAVLDPDGAVQIATYIAVGGTEVPSQLSLRKFCAEVLPAYMVPDRIVVVDALPKTSTDKVDYERLRARS